MKNFEPRILGFCYNWAAYSAIKQAGMNETQYPANLCLLPVTCSGIITPETILQALVRGVDGVFISACSHYSKACSHQTGNLSASYNVARVRTITDFTEEIRKLGPNRSRKKGGKNG